MAWRGGAGQRTRVYFGAPLGGTTDRRTSVPWPAGSSTLLRSSPSRPSRFLSLSLSLPHCPTTPGERRGEAARDAWRSAAAQHSSGPISRCARCRGVAPQGMCWLCWRRCSRAPHSSVADSVACSSISLELSLVCTALHAPAARKPASLHLTRIEAAGPAG